MKRILLALTLLWSAHAFAQNTCGGIWCMTGITIKASGVDVTTVAPGGTVTITVAFQNTSSSAQPAVTLGVSIFDPTKTQITGSGVWLPGNNFTAGQTIVTTFDFIAPATPGTYTIGAGVWTSDGANPLWDGAAQAFLVTAPATAARVHASCYPPAAVAFSSSLTSSPPAAGPAFIETWFCPDPAGQNGYVGYGFYGYVSELVPNWATLWVSWLFAPKATLDAAIDQYASGNDQELRPLEQAQLANTWPPSTAFLRGNLPPPVTSAPTVYYVIQQANKFLAIPVGTAPVGTACDMTQSVDGMYGVPTSAVTWAGSVHPLAVVAKCL